MVLHVALVSLSCLHILYEVHTHVGIWEYLGTEGVRAVLGKLVK